MKNTKKHKIKKIKNFFGAWMGTEELRFIIDKEAKEFYGTDYKKWKGIIKSRGK